MQPTRLIPPGCPVGQGELLAASPRHIAHVSQRSLLVYDAQTLGLVQMTSAHKKNQTALAWNPVEETTFATASEDKQIIQWYASTSSAPWNDSEFSQPLVTIATPEVPVQLDWNERDSSTLGVLFKNGRIATADMKSKDQLTDLLRRERTKHALKDKIVANLPVVASSQSPADIPLHAVDTSTIKGASQAIPQTPAGGTKYEHWPSLVFYEHPDDSVATVIRFAPRKKAPAVESLVGNHIVGGVEEALPECEQSRLAIGCADGTVRIVDLSSSAALVSRSSSPDPSGNGVLETPEHAKSSQLPIGPIVCRPPISTQDSQNQSMKNQPILKSTKGESAGMSDFAVADVRWNPFAVALSESLDSVAIPDLLVLYSNGRIAAFNSLTGHLVVDFLKQHDGPITSICFLPNSEAVSILGAPNSFRCDLFFTASNMQTHLTLWTTSLQFPLQLIPLGDTTQKPSFPSNDMNFFDRVNALMPIPKSNGNFVYLSNQGALNVVNLPSALQRGNRVRNTSHNGPVFDLCSKPSDCNIFATCSWDGTIRVWRASDMMCLDVLRPEKAALTGQIVGAVAGNLNGQNIQNVASSASSRHILASSTFRPLAPASGEVPLNASSLNFSSHTSPTSLEDFHAAESKEVDGFGANTLRRDHKTQSQAYYAIAWGPSGSNYENYIVAAYGSGAVHVWDTNTSSLIREISIGVRRPILRLAWSNFDPNVIAAASGELSLTLFNLQGTVTQRLVHPQEVYSVDFHPTNPKLLATGTTGPSGGIVRVWDLSSPQLPLSELRGHSARIFSVKWSYLNPELLASAGDDRSIRVWRVSKTGKASIFSTLNGATDKLRALQWNYEVPNILLSTGWGASVQIWDIRQTDKPIAISACHNQDVYAIACHKERPFNYISASRDGSIREYSIARPTGLLRGLYAQTIVGSGLDPAVLSSCAEVVVTKHPVVLSTPGSGPLATHELHEVVLCGEMSRRLSALLSKDSKPAGNDEAENSDENMNVHRSIHDFFSSSQFINALWQLVKRVQNPENQNEVVKGEAINSLNPIAHMFDLRAKLWERASTLINGSLGKAKSPGAIAESEGYRIVSADKLASHSSPAQLDQAAKYYLQLGNMMQFCEIQIALGRWQNALALAPSVSPTYWKLLARRFATHLSSSYSGSSDQKIEDDPSIHVALGNVGGYVKLMSATLETIDGALGAALGEAVGAWPYGSDLNDLGSKSVTSAEDQADQEELQSKLSEDKERYEADLRRESDVPVTSRLLEVATIQSDMFQRLGQPILAACAFAGIGDISKAVKCLVQGDEIFLAFSLCTALSLPQSDYVFRAAAQRCESMGLWEEALQCTQFLSSPRDEASLLVGRFTGSSSRRITLYLKAGLQLPNAYLELGRQQLAACRASDTPAVAPTTGVPASTKNSRRGGSTASATNANETPASNGEGSSVESSTEMSSSGHNYANMSAAAEATASLVASSVANLNPTMVVQDASSSPEATTWSKLQKKTNALTTLIISGNYYEAVQYGLECLREILIRAYFRTDELEAFTSPLASIPIETFPLPIRAAVQAYIYYGAALKAVAKGHKRMVPILFALVDDRAKQMRASRAALTSEQLKQIALNDSAAGALIQTIGIFEFPLSTATLLFQSVCALSWLDPVLAYPFACSLAMSCGVGGFSPIGTQLQSTPRVKSILGNILKNLQANSEVRKAATNGSLENIAASLSVMLPPKWIEAVPLPSVSSVTSQSTVSSPTHSNEKNLPVTTSSTATFQPAPIASTSGARSNRTGSKSTQNAQSAAAQAAAAQQLATSNSLLEPSPLSYPSTFPSALKETCPLSNLPLAVCPDFGAYLSALPAQSALGDLENSADPILSYFPAGLAMPGEPPSITGLTSEMSSNYSYSALTGQLIASGDIHVLEDGKSIISRKEAMEWIDCCELSPLPTGARMRI